MHPMRFHHPDLFSGPTLKQMLVISGKDFQVEDIRQIQRRWIISALLSIDQNTEKPGDFSSGEIYTAAFLKNTKKI